DPAVRIAGVVLNRVAGARHEKIIRDSIQQHCGVPVIGAVPKLKRQRFPERHMGLVPTYEHQWAQEAVGAIAELAENHVDLSALAHIARIRHGAWHEQFPGAAHQAAAGDAEKGRDLTTPRPRIGIIRDTAFQFYYPENLDALVQAGAELVVTSPLFEDNLPAVDGLYIGGGFPETHAARLARNVTYRDQLKALAEAGMPIYAECGGLMYLGEALILDEGTFPMSGVLPIRFGFAQRPLGHGYTTLRVARPNPFFDVGLKVKGHEFHYSTIHECKLAPEHMAFDMTRGSGVADGRDGLCHNNVLATYTHIHALGTPQWAPALVQKAMAFRSCSA
ncbi:MAG: hydrogenobyrinic acid a,c-diamide synthase (glutamine-hydrolyzing), partial [Desulfatitalea sp.]|nr:hydrogenobyrinic acid a,c-diamide synthase (glutamine-hydrolyzing) [Desulfatitalea sp.]